MYLFMWKFQEKEELLWWTTFAALRYWSIVYIFPECSALKHQQNIEAFGKELRDAFGPKAWGEVLNWEYTIYAKNLSKSINEKYTT